MPSYDLSADLNVDVSWIRSVGSAPESFAVQIAPADIGGGGLKFCGFSNEILINFLPDFLLLQILRVTEVWFVLSKIENEHSCQTEYLCTLELCKKYELIMYT